MSQRGERPAGQHTQPQQPTQPAQQQPPSTPSSSSPLLSSHLTFSSLPSRSAHYGSDLWDSIPCILAQQDQTKQLTGRLAKFLKEKAELDREYARNLKKLVGKLGVAEHVVRVNEIPIPPAAAAQVALQVVKGEHQLEGQRKEPTTHQKERGAEGKTQQETGEKHARTASQQDTTPSSSPRKSTSSSSSTSSASSAPPVDPLSFDRFLTSYRNLHATLATNSEILSAKIIEQVAKPLSHQREVEGAAAKRLGVELDKYTSSYQKHLATLLETRAACQKACLESEAMRRKLEFAQQQQQQQQRDSPDGGGSSGRVMSDLLNSFKSDVSTLSKRALACDAKYIHAVKSMRGFRQETDSTLAHLLDQYEALHLGRVKGVKELLQHYLLIHQQMLSSNQKNLQAVQGVLERVDPHVDLQWFILCNSTGKLPIALPEYQVFQGHPSYSLQGKDSKGGEEDVGTKMQGDITGMSSAQMEEGGDLLPDEPRAASSSSSSILPSKLKPSGWGWLNTLASVVGTGAGKGAQRAAIDHDAETVLTRGGNFYEQQAQRGEAEEESGSTLSPLTSAASSAAAAPSRSSSFASGEDGPEDASAELSVERKVADQVLADYFDAITGRTQVQGATASTNGGGAGGEAASPASISSPASGLTSPSPASPSTGAGVVVTYSPARERDLTPEELSRAQQLFSTPDGRRSFSAVLNRQRNTSGGLRLSSLSALRRLASLTHLFLDAAKEAMHVAPAQLVMIMSQSFYTEDIEQEGEEQQTQQEEHKEQEETEESSQGRSQSSRTYLLSLIRSHPIWKDLRFWEEAFFDAFHSKIRKSAAGRVVQKWHSDLEQAESLHTRKQVCFSTLTTFAHNMLDFGAVHRQQIVAFVEKIASINELEPEQMEMLRSMQVYQRLPQEEEEEEGQSSVGSPATHTHAAHTEDEGVGGDFEEVEKEEERTEPTHSHTDSLP